MVSRITPSSAERAQGTLTDETVDAASQRFSLDGALVLENIVDPALVAAARSAFAQTYARHLERGAAREEDGAAKVGDDQRMITVDVAAAATWSSPS